MSPVAGGKNLAAYYLGIDPGENGSASIVSERGNPIALEISKSPSFHCLRFGKATEHEMAIWFKEVAKLPNLKAALEKVRAMPGQGVSSMFTFGWNYGLVRGFLCAFQIPFIEPVPQTWQKKLGIVARKKEETQSQFKTRLKIVAQERWPVYTSAIVNDNADSLLIAEYARLVDTKK